MGVIAVITPTLASHPSPRATRALREMPRTREWHVRIFRERELALAWLAEHKGVIVED